MKRFELLNRCRVDLTGRMLGAGIVKEPLGFLDVPPRDVEGVFKSGVVPRVSLSMAPVWSRFPADSSKSAGNQPGMS